MSIPRSEKLNVGKMCRCVDYKETRITGAADTPGIKRHTMPIRHGGLVMPDWRFMATGKKDGDREAELGRPMVTRRGADPGGFFPLGAP
jgi:hypothetical protein